MTINIKNSYYMKPPIILGATLLTKEEAETLLTKKQRKYHSYWWLRTPDDRYNYIAHDVEPDGFIFCNGVSDNTESIRPALNINITSSGYKIGDIFVFGNKKFKIISPTLAFICDDDIGHCAFRKDQNAKDANVYEVSDVKKYIDTWLEEVKQKQISTGGIKVYSLINLTIKNALEYLNNNGLDVENNYNIEFISTNYIKEVTLTGDELDTIVSLSESYLLSEEIINKLKEYKTESLINFLNNNFNSMDLDDAITLLTIINSVKDRGDRLKIKIIDGKYVVFW